VTLDEVETLRREIQEQFRLRDERWTTELNLRDRAVRLAHENIQTRMGWWFSGIGLLLTIVEVVLHFVVR